MAYNEQDAEILRTALKDEANITEKKMFGGICFFLNGNMLCGVNNESAMFRVGKENEETALKIKSVSSFDLTGRKMGGMVKTPLTLLHQAKARKKILTLALQNIHTLPPKKKKN